MRTFSPMKSEVDVTFGFSRSILETGTPVLVEMTPNVSPALTVQYCRLFAVVETCGDFGMLLVVGRRRRRRRPVLEPRPHERDGDRDGEQERCRRGIPPPVLAGPHYQPDAAQISFFSRAASAPAASR